MVGDPKGGVRMRLGSGRTISGLLLAFVLTLLLAASGCQHDEVEPLGVEQSATTANPLLYPYCSASSCSGGVTFNVGDVTQAWTNWKTRHITSMPAGTCAVPAAPQFRVCKLDDRTTVSEGMGYGMMFAALFDEQALFDGLWLWTKGRLNAQGLMTWKICADGANNTNCGSGAATDGDVDMALGLVFACMKKVKGAWGAGAQGINYCADATTLVNTIYNREIEKSGPAPTMASGATNGLNSTHANQVIPGDQWGSVPAGGITNPSYFAPSWFTVFGKFMDSANASPPGSGNLTKWNSVISTNYAIVNAAQNIGCSKLVPDWTNYAGAAVNPGFDPNFADWHFDAARFAFRIAVDKAWYNSASAASTINPIGSFFRSAGSANWGLAFHMNGTSYNPGGTAFFTANAAAAVWAAGASATAVNCGAATGQTSATPQTAYNAALASVEPSSSNFTYFNNAWRLLALLLMTGNFPNIYELAVAAPTIPAPPTGLTATAGNGQVALTWNASAGATSYTVLRGTTSGGPYGTTVVTNHTTTSFTNTSLTNGTTYFFVVRAVNAAGTSGNSAQASATPTAGTIPPAPTNLVATPGNQQVALTWNASTGATSYTVLRATVSGGPYTSVQTGITTTSFTNTSLTNGTTYFYVVRAVNAFGTSGNSNQASATPTAGTIPPAPTNLVATAGNQQVALTWNASTGATSYTVLRATVSGGPYISVQTGITTTSFTNTSLTNGTTYFFVVRAVNAAGTSGNSAQASATPTAGSGPCASFCANPTIFSTASFQSGNLTTAARCFQTTANLAGGNCSNMTDRTLSVNGTAANCNGWSLPAKVNNGYCIQVTAGGVAWASFSTW
jgi:endo-1,4-beta-D-glucanase Y/fibronectin type 3 domain-containing protein